MTLVSIARLRWKTIALSLVLVYVIYFFGALDNIADRRDILLEHLKSEVGATAAGAGAVTETTPGSTAQKDSNPAKEAAPAYVPADISNPAKDTAPADARPKDGTAAKDAAPGNAPAEVPIPAKWHAKHPDPFLPPSMSSEVYRKPKGVEKNPPVNPESDEYIAFCVAVKDQAQDLPEFLMHHYYNMGVGKFYIMDDGSNPPLSTYAEKYGIPQSALTFDFKPFGNKTVQWMQYALDDRCIKVHGGNHTWMAFIDADEFIETRGNDTLRGMLEELDAKPEVGALGINWRIHTSAGLKSRPHSSRKGFTQCIGDVEADDGTKWMDNKGIKSIVKVKSYKLPMNPHQFYLKNNQTTVGEHGDVLPYGASRTPITRDRISLHHYAIKSLGEFEEKMTRWSAKGWDYWKHIEEYRVLHECKEMQKYDP